MGTRVYVGRLPYDVRERDIEKFFKGYGKIREVLMKDGFAFVEFDDHRDADDAVYELNGKELLNERYVSCICFFAEHCLPTVCLWRSLDGLAEAGLLIDSPVDLEEEADPGTTLKSKLNSFFFSFCWDHFLPNPFPRIYVSEFMLNLLGVLPGVEVVEEEDVVLVVPALDMDRREAPTRVEEEIVVLACHSPRSMVPQETRSIELSSRT